MAIAGVVVGVDVLFFRGHVWERLAANVGIVSVFVAGAVPGFVSPPRVGYAAN